MKTIAFVLSPVLPFPPIKGGAVQNLVDQVVLSNNFNEDVKISIIALDFGLDKQLLAKSYSNINFYYIKVPKALVKIRDKQIRYLSGRLIKIIELLYINGIKKVLEKNNFDKIIFENTLKYSKALNKYLHNTKRILHLHNDYISENIKSSEYLEEYDQIICISKYIEQCVKRKKSNAETVVIYNGIETSKFYKNYVERMRLRNKYNISDNTKAILFSGRVVREKGVKELIQAINLVDSDIVLVILGSKVYGKDIEDVYRTEVMEEISKCNKRVICTGYVDYKDIQNYYSMCDIGSLPTIWEEPLSLSVIEYMSASLPIIISNSGGMIELFEEGCGCIVDKDEFFIQNIAQSIESLIIDAEKYNECSRKAKERSKLFDTKNYVEKMNDILFT